MEKSGVIIKSTYISLVKFSQIANLNAVLHQIEGKQISCKNKFMCDFQIWQGIVLRNVVILAQFLQKSVSISLSI